MLVDLTRPMDDVLGSRMMGGGFGGCTVNLVKASGIKRFTEKITNEYFQQFNKEPLIYLVKLTDGARELH
jgi:galactokinase